MSRGRVWHCMGGDGQLISSEPCFWAGASLGSTAGKIGGVLLWSIGNFLQRCLVTNIGRSAA
jgi:hypothetical protein